MMEQLKTNIKRIKNSVFANFIISYGIIFIIPVIIIFTTYYHVTTSIVEKEIDTAKLMPVNQFKRLMEDEIKRARSISGFINNNTDLFILMGLKKEDMTPRDQLNIWKMSRLLSEYAASNTFINNMYIYLKKSHYCISVGGARADIDMFQYFHESKREEIDFETWSEILNQYHSGGIMSIHKNTDFSYKDKTNLYYLQSLPLLPIYSSDATLVLQFSQEAIKNAMNVELLAEDTYLSLIDQEGRPLISSSSTPPIEFDSSMMTEDKGYFNYKGHTVSYIRSNIVPGSFVTVIPETKFTESLYDIQRLFLLILFICISLGAVLTYLFTMRNYNPVKQLLQITRQYSLSNRKEDEDAFTEIRLALLDAIDNKMQFESLKKTEEETKTKNKILYMLLDSTITEQKMNQYLERNNIKLVEKYFYLLRIQLSDYSTHLFDFGSGENDIIKPLSICSDVYQGLLSVHFYTESFIDESSILILVSRNKELFNEVNSITETVLEAQKFMRDNYAVDTYVAISSVHDSITQMDMAYKEALEAIQYLELIGKESVVVYEDFSQINPTEKVSRFIIKEEQSFFGSLKAGNFKEAKQTLNQIIEKYFFDDVHAPELVRCRLFALMNNIVDTLVTLDIPNMNQFVQELDPYNRILNCNNVNELQQELNMLMDEISSFEMDNGQDEEYVFKQKVIEIVQENYVNPDLNVSFIAEIMGKNLDYVSRTFKKTTLIGLLDYIHHTRIKAAKVLLGDEGNLTVLQISSMVGYTNCDSFIRAFKRVEGVTPGKYRKLAEKDNWII